MTRPETQAILIVDDEPDIRRLLSLTVERMGFMSHAAANVESAEAALSEKSFQLCLTDLKLPDGSGLDLVEHIQLNYQQTPVIVITAHGSMDVAVKAMKSGAFDFINKPVDLKNLRALIQSALSTNQRNQKRQSISDITGKSRASLLLKDQIARVSRSQAPVFIHGESGSGKELVARSIHKLSSRDQQPFIAVNCGAIPKELMESEFFGHTKGSFTGALQNKEGLFQAAEGGTLFLDEVADLSMDMQVKLLRAIQEKSIRPVGAQKEIAIDVRILSATHKNLLSAVSEGRFRNDLYYRINVIDIAVPPLRERLEDIPLLCELILNKIAGKNQTEVISTTQEALKKLESYHFPGNIRELENILERACALCDGRIIESEDLNFTDDIPIIAEAPRQQPQMAEPARHESQNQGPMYDPKQESIDEYLAKQEKEIILKALEQNRWNRTTTAKLLGVTFRSLRYRMKKLGIDDD